MNGLHGFHELARDANGSEVARCDVRSTLVKRINKKRERLDSCLGLSIGGEHRGGITGEGWVANRFEARRQGALGGAIAHFHRSILPPPRISLVKSEPSAGDT